MIHDEASARDRANLTAGHPFGDSSAGGRGRVRGNSPDLIAQLRAEMFGPLPGVGSYGEMLAERERRVAIARWLAENAGSPEDAEIAAAELRAVEALAAELREFIAKEVNR